MRTLSQASFTSSTSSGVQRSKSSKRLFRKTEIIRDFEPPVPTFGAMNTQQYDEDEDFIWANNGGVQDHIRYTKNNVIINVSRKGKDDKGLFDVYISLKCLPEERLIATISKKQSLADLYKLVIEALVMKYEFFKGLKGIRIKEMIVQIGDIPGMVQSEQQYHLYEEPDILSKNKLMPRAHILVDIESQDIWISILLRLHSPDFTNFEANFEIKIDQKMNGKELKMLIQKLSISIWNQLCKEAKKQFLNETSE